MGAWCWLDRHANSPAVSIDLLYARQKGLCLLGFARRESGAILGGPFMIDTSEVSRIAPSTRPSLPKSGNDTGASDDLASRESLRESEDLHFVSFRRDRPVLWWSTLVGPFAVSLAALIVFGIFKGWAATITLIGTAIVTFFVASRMVILLGQAPLPVLGWQVPFSPEFLFGLVIWMDLVAAIVLVYHMGLLFRIPKVGNAILALSEDAQVFVSTQPWIRRLTFLGLIVFVAVPLAATGSVGGAIFGRLLGLSRLATITAITVGSFIGCGIIYAFGEAFEKYVGKDNPVLLWGGLGAVVAILLLLNWRYGQLKKRMRASGTLK